MHTHITAHPECNADVTTCTCDELYGYVRDGLDRAIEVAMRLDARRVDSLLGGGVDIDENPTEAPDDRRDTTHAPSGDYGQLWKRSEFLKCKRGPHTMQDLDMTFMQRGNWLRAKESEL